MHTLLDSFEASSSGVSYSNRLRAELLKLIELVLTELSDSGDSSN